MPLKNLKKLQFFLLLLLYTSLAYSQYIEENIKIDPKDYFLPFRQIENEYTANDGKLIINLYMVNDTIYQEEFQMFDKYDKKITGGSLHYQICNDGIYQVEGNPPFSKRISNKLFDDWTEDGGFTIYNYKQSFHSTSTNYNEYEDCILVSRTNNEKQVFKYYAKNKGLVKELHLQNENLVHNIELIDYPKEKDKDKIDYSKVIPYSEVENKEKSPKIFSVVEQMPSFPGGDAARLKYISENIQYPLAAKVNKIEGKVYLTFVVETDGSLSNISVLRGIGGGCDEESIRMAENMPNWEPGKQRGKPVRVQYNMPIKFKLNNK